MTANKTGQYAANNIEAQTESYDPQWNKIQQQPVSFLHRIIPFGNNTQYSEKCECFVPKRSVVIDEIKSVQSLKQFWISAFGGGSGGTASVNSVKYKKCDKLCCLKSKSSTLTTSRTSENLYDHTKFLSLNKSSLISPSDVRFCVSSPERKLSIDNFYKYKTADLVKNHRISDIHYSCHRLKDKTNELKFAPFSASSIDENPHWACCNDIKNEKENKSEHEKESFVLIKDSKMLISTDKKIHLNGTLSTNKAITTTTTEMGADKKHRYNVAYLTKITAADKITSSCSKSTTSSTNSVSSESPRKQITATRKCSFRTNSFHHHHKKMAVGNGGSKVAALTHRFNQLIQQDADILEEVKRNKELILHRLSGHVFKIKTEEVDGKKRVIKKSDNGDSSSQKSVKKKPSVIRKISIKTSKPGSVKAAIEIFEQDSVIQSINKNEAHKVSVYVEKPEKPKVPDKSPQVLLRTKEIVVRNNLKKIKPTVTNETIVSTPLPSGPVDNRQNDRDDVTVLKERRITLEKIKEDIEDKEDVEYKGSNENREIKIDDSNDQNVSSIIEDNDIKTELLSPLSDNDTEAKGKKNKKSRLYEKFCFKPYFLYNNANKKNAISRLSPEIETNTNNNNPDKKIVDALCSVNQRIEQLSKSENCLSWDDEDKHYEEVTQNMKPNISFLFRSTSKNMFSSAYDIASENRPVEAINPFVISKTRSMDETRFPSTIQLTKQISLEEGKLGALFKETDELISKIKESIQKEDDYEVIKTSDSPCMDEEGLKLKIDKPIIEEPINDLSTDSFVHKEYQKINMSQNHVEDSSADSSGIYQSISEAKSGKTTDKDCDSLNSYESFENYEAVDDLLVNIKTENGYEICDPPEPPPPRKTESDTKVPTEPALPIPKRNFINFDLHKSDSLSSNYEKIKYDKIPPRPPKSPCYFPKNVTSSQSSDSMYADDYEENIYDTIKNIDSTSMTDYESISLTTNFLRTDRILKHSDSASTLSSDNKTNSLYGTSMGGRGVTPPSEGGSENSDEWIDISDGEEEKKHKFVVICERKKYHRSPDWSSKVRDQRMNQQNQDQFEDDSDHYYETLDATEKNHPVNSLTTDTRKLSIINISASSNGHNSHNGQPLMDDEYDSFDSDEESDDDVKKNDSGVDVSNTRLPDPPTPTSQVYAFMQKIKNFGSLSKNLTKLTKKKVPPPPPPTARPDEINSPKQYENTHFFVRNDYQNVEPKTNTKTRSKAPKLPKKKEKPIDPYENTEFHSPRSPSLVSSNTLIADVPASGTLNHSDNLPLNNKSDLIRKKSKSGKSFKSKFRKSLGPETNINLGTSFNGTRSTFYISDSVDVDSGIFTSADKVPVSDELNALDTNQIIVPSIEVDSIPTLSRRSKTSSNNSPELNRRKSSLGVRPINPPPPPPVDKRIYKTKRLGTTSWYAECGVFKSEALKNSQSDNLKNCSKKERNSTSSWYADAGLYQTSGASVASSSGSSGVSTGGECGPGDDNSHSMFLNEPLYQIYSAAKLESITKDIEMDNENSDGYEEIGGSQHQDEEEEEKKPSRPSALQLVGPKQGPSRTLWSEIPEVINSQILSTLTPTEKRLQEAKFEILTSEASYLKSLTLLRTHFMNHPAFRDTSILSSSDRKTLFSFIISVQECSDRLLCDLENCWQDNIMLLGLSHSVYKHAEKYFTVYVSYCEHQGKLDRTLKRLKESKTAFIQTLEILETDSACCGLSLYSFLMLPMQRITRLPLLVDAVFSKLKIDDDEFESWKMTLALLNKIVSQCNDAANRSEQIYEMEVISRQIEFPPSIRPLAILPVGVSAPGHIPRSLVRRGELTHLIWRGEDGKLTFGKKFSKISIYAFLFTDLIVLAKKRSEESYTVFDYCPRSLLTVSSGDVIPQLPTKELSVAGKHLVFMTLLENHDGKMVEMILSCPSETERQRWLHATEPPASENPDEKLYEQWDCPQVIAKHTYIGLQRDELCLDPGDVVNVTRKMADGWYQGERIRDGAQGWFPGNYTEEVASPHVRARNLKQRYRLLTFTAAYWESQKRK